MKYQLSILLIFAALLWSCKSIQTPTVVTIQRDTTHTAARDSSHTGLVTRDTNALVVRMDSTLIERWHNNITRGDTVVVRDSVVVVRTILHQDERVMRETIYDTIYVGYTDTIRITNDVPVEVPVRVEVEKQSGKFLRVSGIIFWVLLALGLCAIIAGIIIKFAK